MSDEIKPVPQKPLNERIQDMFRELLPGVLSDEDIKEITQRGIEEMFFKPRIKHHPHRSWNEREEELPPLIHEIIEGRITEGVRQATLDYLQAHPEAVKVVLEKAVERGALWVFFDVLSKIFQNMFIDNLGVATDRGYIPNQDALIQTLRNAGVNI